MEGISSNRPPLIRFRTTNRSKSTLSLSRDTTTNDNRQPNSNNSNRNNDDDDESSYKRGHESSMTISLAHALGNLRSSCDSSTVEQLLSDGLNFTAFNLDSRKLYTPPPMATTTELPSTLLSYESRIYSMSLTSSTVVTATKPRRTMDYSPINPAITAHPEGIHTSSVSKAMIPSQCPSSNHSVSNCQITDENFQTRIPSSMPAKTSLWSFSCLEDTLRNTLCVFLTAYLGATLHIKSRITLRFNGLITLLLYVGTMFQYSEAGFACLSNPCVFGVCIDGLNRYDY